jgi:hypothetical protein
VHFRILFCLYKEIESITPCFVLSTLEPLNLYSYWNKFSFYIFFLKLKYFVVNFNNPPLVGLEERASEAINNIYPLKKI